MPFLKKIDHADYQIGLWLFAEDPDELAEQETIAGDLSAMYGPLNNLRRKREVLASHRLMHLLTGHPTRLFYDAEGRPVPDLPGMHVSISHSASLAAVIISAKPAGIDVEEISRNVGRVAERFLAPGELKWTGMAVNPAFSRLICWCAKEAIYKMMAEKGTHFADQMEIFPFENGSHSLFHAVFRKEGLEKKITLSRKEIQGNVVVWCVDQ